jgi:hypothetical protein
VGLDIAAYLVLGYAAILAKSGKTPVGDAVCMLVILGLGLLLMNEF